MPRKRFDWKLKHRHLRLGDRALLVAVLNVQPDAAGGGRFEDPDRAFVRAMEIADQGADILELGAESMRPGSARISEAEELRRLIPVVKRLKGRLDIPLCIETWKAAVADKALSLGAEIIRDPSGLTLDPTLARVVANHDAGLVITHMRGSPEGWARLAPLKDPVNTISLELGAAISRATRGGMLRQRLAVDPGLGCGKRKEQNAEILRLLGKLHALELPLFIAASNRELISPQADEQAPYVAAAAVAVAVLAGAHFIRVHEVSGMRGALLAAEAIAGG
jgi:dihydropteroate synthase